MARFEGTIQEYHNFIGPRIRNKVNNLTVSARKKKYGICEHCGQEKELQSAHVHGNERRVIIENVLSRYQQDGLISCDLAEVEKKILQAHQPIEENFLFLCQGCHRKYDHNKTHTIKHQNKKEGHRMLNEKFSKIERIELWAKKPNQIKSITKSFAHICLLRKKVRCFCMI